MSDKELFQKIKDNPDLLNIIKKILEEKGIIEIIFEKGKIKKKTHKKEFWIKYIVLIPKV